jgi:3-hydroxyisobutyrate dehydrogenase
MLRTVEQIDVAVVGLGRMGMALCERLVACGFAVTATDIRSETRAEAQAAGARWAGAVPVAARGARYVITCLPGDAEVESVTGELTGAMREGAVWIEMSTASPGVARRRDAAAAARGLHALDAPVGGNPDAARRGQLLCLVGGGSEVLRSARPALEAVADRIVHVGPAGAGYLMKLLANSIWFTQALATAEALALAARAGLDPETARQALALTAATGRFLTDDAPAFLRGDNYESFGLSRCCDQLAAVVELGAQLAVQLSVTTEVADLHRQALAHYGDVDGELLGARWVAERAGLNFSQDVQAQRPSREDAARRLDVGPQHPVLEPGG